MTLELTTNIGVGGWPGLSRDQQVGALAWLRNQREAFSAVKEPPAPKLPKTTEQREANRAEFNRRLAAMRDGV